MPDQDDLDATSKAWTYAVLDAAEAADEKTRLEIARILCPAGFVIVPTESVEPPKEQKTKSGHEHKLRACPRETPNATRIKWSILGCQAEAVVGPDDDSRHRMSSDGTETPVARRDRRERPNKSGKTHD